jgi:hypothetical protein
MPRGIGKTNKEYKDVNDMEEDSTVNIGAG